MEWIHEGLPPIGSAAQVWLTNDETRAVQRDTFFGELWFSDCTEPMQNMYCAKSRVQAWRLTHPLQQAPQKALEKVLPDTSGQIEFFP